MHDTNNIEMNLLLFIDYPPIRICILLRKVYYAGKNPIRNIYTYTSKICTILRISVFCRRLSGLALKDLREIVRVRKTYACAYLTYRQFRFA